MHPVQQHLFATNFRDLSGTQLEGTIALSDELINLGILDLLRQLKPGNTVASADFAPKVEASDAPGLPNPKDLLQRVNVEQLEYRTEAGRTLLKIKVGVV